MQDIYKVIIVLSGVLLGSWTLFGVLVVRWVNATDSNVKELYDKHNNTRDMVIEIKAKCEERHR